MILKMALDITGDGRDVKRSALIKDNNERLITESKGVLRIMGSMLQGATGRKRSSKLPRTPELG